MVLTNLNKLKELDEREKFDKIVCLGDMYYAGPLCDMEVNSQKVLEFLNGFKDRLIAVRGNCDSDVDIKVSDFPVCDNLSFINVDNLNLYLTHGNVYNIDNKPKFNHNEILVYGHKHYPFIIKEDGNVFINVGSILLPRNNSNPTYGIYHNGMFRIYDIYENEIKFIQFR